MKLSILIVLIVTVLMIFTSCLPAQTMTATATITQDNEALSQQLSQLQTDYDNLLAKYQAATGGTQTTTSAAATNLADLQAKYDSLQTAYNNLTKNSGQTGLHDPSWTDLKEFIKSDDIDTVTYNLNTFACSGYAIILRDRARKLGIRTAYVQVAFPGSAGHALDAFQTTDKGLIYIDCTEADKVAYVKVGQPYGTIQIDAVQEKYIDCTGAPGDFWQPLKYIETANPFSYDYYLDYQKRWDFSNQSVDAYNQAVDQFNSGNGQLTQAQMMAWQDNLNALGKELGNTAYESPGTTGNIEIYWGDNP